MWPITDKESQRSLCTFLVCKRRKLRSADWWTQSVSEALTLKDRIKNKRKSYSIFSLEVQLLTLCLETRSLRLGTTWVFWMHSVTCFDTSEKLKTKLPVHCTCLCFFFIATALPSVIPPHLPISISLLWECSSRTLSLSQDGEGNGVRFEQYENSSRPLCFKRLIRVIQRASLGFSKSFRIKVQL